MKTIKLVENWDLALESAKKVLLSDGVVIYPTDTLYGIGGNALKKNVVERIRKMKNTEKYEKALEYLIRDAIEAMGGKKFKISCSDEDREKVSRISAKIIKELGVEIRLGSKSIDTVGGVRVTNEDGSTILDNT
ncbi:MAG: Sua5/YciO/YrdC/YwlC family protein, partial [Candidatus Micrarchaeia archaeon]